MDSTRMPPVNVLGMEVRSKFETAKADRRLYELRWVEDLMLYKGVYSTQVLSQISNKRSRTFVRLTRTKVKSMDARMMDMLFPAGGEKNWSADPTPAPTIAPNVRKLLQARAAQMLGHIPEQDEMDQIVYEWAKERAESMSTEIEDQLVEGRYIDKARSVIHSGNVFGTGWLKAPMVTKSISESWEPTDAAGNDFEVEIKETLKPHFEAVSIFDLYPDLSVTNIEDCSFMVQRHVMNKFDVMKLSDRPDFSRKVIRNFIKNNPEGNATYEPHDIELRNATVEQAVVDEMRHKYEVLEFWGYIDAGLLRDAGVKVPEKAVGDVLANIWVIGNEVIRALLHPGGRMRQMYFPYYFEKDDTSIYGVGIPSIMKDVQENYNAAVRMSLDNAAITAGPQVEVNLSLLTPQQREYANEIYPFKVWLRQGVSAADHAAPALRVTQLPSYVGQLTELAQMFKEMADEVTAIPSYLHGESTPGVGRTVGGLSMLMGAANITVKDVIRNYDEVTKRFITAMYDWNMLFNDKKGIKGDFDIKARGTSSLVAKEVRAQALTSFGQMTFNPVDLKLVDRARLLKSMLDALDLPDDLIKESLLNQADPMGEEAVGEWTDPNAPKPQQMQPQYQQVPQQLNPPVPTQVPGTIPSGPFSGSVS